MRIGTRLLHQVTMIGAVPPGPIVPVSKELVPTIGECTLGSPPATRTRLLFLRTYRVPPVTREADGPWMSFFTLRHLPSLNNPIQTQANSRSHLIDLYQIGLRVSFFLTISDGSWGILGAG